MNGLALCAGVGGIELGLQLALGERYRTVGYVERDSYAAAVLVARMANQALDPAPIWDDLQTFDGGPWRGAVDIATAGFPCQPVSLAGKRLVQDDYRWLWPAITRVVREVEPGLVFLENVPGLLVHGMGDVLRDLAQLGYGAEWGVFSAAQSGAPHLRRRVFILAHTEGAGEATAQLKGSAPKSQSRGGESGLVAPANADSQRRTPTGSRVVPGRSTSEQEREPAFGRSTGEVWRTTESPVCRSDDVAADRMDRLRCLGNGVVPAVAARAFLELLSRVIV